MTKTIAQVLLQAIFAVDLRYILFTYLKESTCDQVGQKRDFLEHMQLPPPTPFFRASPALLMYNQQLGPVLP